MRHHDFAFGLLTALALTTMLAVASAADSPEEAAHALVEGIRSEGNIPGMSAAVAVDGEIVWSAGFGLANIEQNVPATAETVYRVGSISKMLTTGAVALLMESGQLDMDAPVQKYVPSFPEKPEGVITTRLLTGHLSGIPHYRPLDPPDWKRPHYKDVVDALAEFDKHRLLHAPGTKYQYSSYAWNLISAVVQGASGMPFLEYMDEAVFEPLGLDSMGPDDPRVIVSNRTEFYTRGPRQTVANARELDISYKWAGGGFLSSVEDLVRFGSAWLPGTDFLKPETIEEVWTNQETADGEKVIAGIGWRVGFDEEKHQIVFHGGHLTGCHAQIMIHPEERVVVAMACNTDNARFGGEEARQLAHLFIDANVAAAP